MKKKSVAKWALAFLVIILAGIQFIPVNRINPPVESDIQCPLEVKAILRSSCYDCHSHETVWPWYSRVAPVSWLLASDAREGRHKLNFSTWNGYSPEKQTVLLSEMMDQIKEGDMPPAPYTWMHKGSGLTPGKVSVIQAWASQNKK